MDSKKEIYEIEFTEDARDEIREIYEYISKNLVNEDAAKRLMRKMRKNVMDLEKSSKIYALCVNLSTLLLLILNL